MEHPSENLCSKDTVKSTVLNLWRDKKLDDKDDKQAMGRESVVPHEGRKRGRGGGLTTPQFLIKRTEH